MPKRTSSYHPWLVEKLKVPQTAESYLRTALEDSQEAFLTALRNVAEARGMSTVAEETGLNRESLYRTLSSEGNPTLNTLSAVLDALGLRMAIAEKRDEPTTSPAKATPAPAPIQDANAVRISSSNCTRAYDLAGSWTITYVGNQAANTAGMIVGNKPASEQLPDVPSVPFYLLGQTSERQEAGQSKSK